MTLHRNKHLSLAVATSTRADWGLLSPLASHLRQRGHEISVIASNMHLRAESGHTLDEIIADGFTPAATIESHGSPADIMARTLEGTARSLTEIKPDAIIILGDRYEMLATASAAAVCGTPIVHIAGGAVSEGAFDDSFRHAITKLASLHLVETEAYRNRVIQMGEQPATVIATGAIGVANLSAVPLMPSEVLEESISAETGQPVSIDRGTLLATLHAATLDPVAPEERQKAFLNAIRRSLDMGIIRNAIITYPNNDVDTSELIAGLKAFASDNASRVTLLPSLGRVRYLSLLHYAGGVAGNSSSGIVEVPSAGIPTLDVGIRQQGRDRAISVTHCEADEESIVAGIARIFSPAEAEAAMRCTNPYFRPDTLSLMAEAIEGFHFSPFPTKKFHNLPASPHRQDI